ncbi:MAG: hypothetical protein IPO81_28145 [Kouleothrix sp.]|nr:hypothetical protein [Kouleothrix sp.]
MRSITKLLARLALVLVALAAFAAPALAAAPNNDTFASAKVVALDFSETLDTTQATTDSDDAQVNQTCGAPATDASVWYAIDGDGGGVKIDVGASTYSAGVIVATGTAGNPYDAHLRAVIRGIQNRGGHATTCWPSTTRATAAATAGRWTSRSSMPSCRTSTSA